jgi:hypothetical protein
MASTQQSEALQAVRLLFVAACGGGSSDHKNPEMLYRARVLLEGFIESAGVLENTEGNIECASNRDKSELNDTGRVFHYGDEIFVPGGEKATISGFMILANTTFSKNASWHPSQVFQIAKEDISKR